jgi:TIR domain
MAAKVFISYRRADANYPARMIYNAFCAVLPRDKVFMDVDSIPLGVDFVEILEGWVEKCEILLALIGPGWADAIDPETSRKRLQNDYDFVRIEIREALKRGIPVVPVLLDGTPMPQPEDLPDDLKNLVRRQAEFVDFRTFDADVERLIKKLGIDTRIADIEKQQRTEHTPIQARREEQYTKLPKSKAPRTVMMAGAGLATVLLIGALTWTIHNGLPSRDDAGHLLLLGELLLLGAAGGLASFLVALKDEHYKNNKYVAKFSIESSRRRHDGLWFGICCTGELIRICTCVYYWHFMVPNTSKASY